MRHIPRIHVTAPLCKGQQVVLSPTDLHHLLTVLRIPEKAEIRLFNAVSGEWRAHLMDKKRGMLECIECLLPSVPTASGTDLGPFPHLLFPLLKSARLTYLLEKSVELGVGALYPIITEHTMVASFNTERWQVVIKQATEQCGRLLMPLVHAPKKLESALAAWPREISLFVGDERPAAPPIAPFLKKMPSKTAFLVGPEGGFSVREFATFDRLSFITCVSLGSTVLRTETATSALLALYAAFH